MTRKLHSPPMPSDASDAIPAFSISAPAKKPTGSHVTYVTSPSQRHIAQRHAEVTNLNDWRQRRHNQDLDDWLKLRPGRCHTCGYHTATQGHHPICSGRTRRAQH